MAKVDDFSGGKIVSGDHREAEKVFLGLGVQTVTLAQSPLSFFGKLLFKNIPKNKNGAWSLAPLDAPCRELLIRTFKSVVAFSVSRQIDF